MIKVRVEKTPLKGQTVIEVIQNDSRKTAD